MVNCSINNQNYLIQKKIPKSKYTLSTVQHMLYILLIFTKLNFNEQAYYEKCSWMFNAWVILVEYKDEADKQM